MIAATAPILADPLDPLGARRSELGGPDRCTSDAEHHPEPLDRLPDQPGHQRLGDHRVERRADRHPALGVDAVGRTLGPSLQQFVDTAPIGRRQHTAPMSADQREQGRARRIEVARSAPSRHAGTTRTARPPPTWIVALTSFALRPSIGLISDAVRPSARPCQSAVCHAHGACRNASASAIRSWRSGVSVRRTSSIVDSATAAPGPTVPPVSAASARQRTSRSLWRIARRPRRGRRRR